MLAPIWRRCRLCREENSDFGWYKKDGVERIRVAGRNIWAGEVRSVRLKFFSVNSVKRVLPHLTLGHVKDGSFMMVDV
jgi:ribosomal protein S28E/S33